MLSQIIICSLTVLAPCKIFVCLSQCHAKYNLFRWILHHYNLLTYSNDHIKNSSYNYIILTCLIYFYNIFHIFIENNYIMNMHTTLLIKYEIKIQDKAIYTVFIILIPPQSFMILHYCVDVIIHPGWVFPTVIWTLKENPRYIDQLVNNINTHVHIKLWSFIAIQYYSNICPNIYSVKYTY